MGAANDQLLLHISGMKWKDNSYLKVNEASATYFRCNAPAHPLFKTHKLTSQFIERWYCCNLSVCVECAIHHERDLR